MGAGDAEHVVAEVLDQPLEVHGDEGLILDDEDVGGDFGGKLAAGLLDQIAQRPHVNIEDRAGVFLGEAFQRDQQEGLPRQRRDVAKPLLDRHLGVGCGLRLGVHVDRIPERGK